MFKKSVVLLALFLCFSCSAIAQQNLLQSVPSPGSTSLITPVNLKPVTIDELLRRRGISDDNPAKNIILFFGTGFIGETATLYQAIPPKKIEINEMDNMQLVLPGLGDDVKAVQLDLIKMLSGNGRAAGLVSDSSFNCFSGKDFVKADSRDLFNHLHLALSVADFDGNKERDALVKDFSGRSIEYAADRKDLDRLFSKKAPKIVGCFKRNMAAQSEQQDLSQPYFDELVAAALSRLSVKNDGFLLVVGARAAFLARKEKRFADMYEHLRMQEKALHQINYFLAGRADTLAIIVEDLHAGDFSFNDKFNLAKFTTQAVDLPILVRDLMNGKVKLPKAFIDNSYLGKADEARIKDLIEKQSFAGLSVYLQQLLAQYYEINFTPAGFASGKQGLAVFARGLGAEILGGLVSYREFIRRISLITGSKQNK